MKKLFLLILITVFFGNTTYGRWSTYEDAALEVEFSNTTLTVNKDGTYEYVIEQQEKILKEQARNYAVSYRLNYNSNSSALTVLEAKTIVNGTEFNVAKDMIEDKPLASQGYGFDTQHQILVSYPNVEIGSSIYIKYKLNVHKILLDNFFSGMYDFEYNKYYKSVNTKVKSAIPLYIKINDPNNVLKVEKNTEGEFDNIVITNTKPAYEETTNEPGNAVVNPKRLSWVSVSSVDVWSEFGNKLSVEYYKVLNQMLPNLFEEIAKVAEMQNTDVEKINIVTSQLNEKIQYMGDWRSIGGKFIPRDLEKIALTQVGDCKDFTISTAAILQKLGFKVAPTLVMRGERNLPYDSLPNFYSMNHVILRVINKDGKVYWIDPTNTVSMADGIFPDIAGKKVLVLNGADSSYEQIPEIDHKHAKEIMRNTWEIKGNGVVNIVGTSTAYGEETLYMAGAGLYRSEEQLKDFMYEMFSGAQLEPRQKKSMILPDLQSRIISNLTYSYEFDQNNKLFKTNLGSAFPLTASNALNRVITVAPNQVGDLMIGYPFTFQKHTYIKNSVVQKPGNLNYEINTPWISVKRSCTYDKKNHVAEIDEVISVLRNFITMEELETEEYKNLKKDLEQNFMGSAIIINAK